MRRIKKKVFVLWPGIMGIMFIVSCMQNILPGWQAVSSPTITYQNDEAAGDGVLFDEAYADYETRIKEIAYDVCRTLYNSPGQVTGIKSIFIHIDDFTSPQVAGKLGSPPDVTIRINSTHLRNVYNDRNGSISEVRTEIDALLYHELTHVYSPNDVEYTMMSGTVEGLADSVVIKHDYKPLFNAARSDDATWDTGYEKTAYFFVWLDEVRFPECDFVRSMTNCLEECDSESWAGRTIEEITGQSVVASWNEYQANWPWPEDRNDETNDGVYVYATPPTVIPVGVVASFYCNLYMTNKNMRYLLKLTCSDPGGGNQFAATSVGPLSYTSKKVHLTGVVRQDGTPCSGSASLWTVHLQDYDNQGTDLVAVDITALVSWQ